MINAKIKVFEMSHEETNSYFTHLKNLEKVKRTNGPSPASLPLDDS
jgi:hypothetical protein